MKHDIPQISNKLYLYYHSTIPVRLYAHTIPARKPEFDLINETALAVSMYRTVYFKGYVLLIMLCRWSVTAMTALHPLICSPLIRPLQLHVVATIRTQNHCTAFRIILMKPSFSTPNFGSWTPIHCLDTEYLIVLPSERSTLKTALS